MKLLLSLGLCAFIVSVPSPARSQLLVSESVDGMHRVCNYSTGLGRDRLRSYRVGFAQACPGTYPVVNPRLPPPPTAALERQAIVRSQRICTYSQSGARWDIPVPLDKYCPLSAGMAERPVQQQQ